MALFGKDLDEQNIELMIAGTSNVAVPYDRLHVPVLQHVFHYYL